MGIETNAALYKMTVNGKRWWGDPTSEDFNVEGMNPFGKKAIAREVGKIFSERDQFVLRTLFYPFSVKFGYVEENSSNFRRDLKVIRPMLCELFDF